MKLRPILNTKLGQWRICHDQWCERGETSIVATIMTTMNEKADGMLAQLICDRFNSFEETPPP
ncbi:hypothetical protein [Rhizobium arsenicireducens]